MTENIVLALAVDGLPMVVDGTVYQQRTRGPERSAAIIVRKGA